MSHRPQWVRLHSFFFSIPADFLSTVYTTHLTHDDNERDFDLMYNYYKTAMSPQEQSRALKALSFTNNTDRLKRYFPSLSS